MDGDTTSAPEPSAGITSGEAGEPENASRGGNDAANDAPSAEASSPDAAADAASPADGAVSPTVAPAPSCEHPPPPPFDPSILTVCPGCAGGARCVPRALVAQAAPDQLDLFAACDEQNVCVPDAVIESGAFYRATPCSSWNEAEGRCLSECLPSVASQRDILPQDVCAPEERCVPCFNPLDDQPTGACTLACDPGPEDPAPTPLASCCGGDGLCLPAPLVPAAQRSELGRDTCAEPSALCAPRVFAVQDARASSCRSIANAEGRCLPTCLQSVSAQGTRLPQSSCDANERCVPCFDPVEGADTGACAINDDKPQEPPVRFDTECCGAYGLCVPEELAGENASRLPADTCAAGRGEGWVCAPRQAVEDPDTPQEDLFASCRVRAAFVTVYRGRCLPRCMVPSSSVIGRALARGSCDSGELCVPCAVAGKIPGCS